MIDPLWNDIKFGMYLNANTFTIFFSNHFDQFKDILGTLCNVLNMIIMACILCSSMDLRAGH